MKAKLRLIREAIAAAQKGLADLQASGPEDLENLQEIYELEMGLEWTMKRVDALRTYLETHPGGREMGRANGPGINSGDTLLFLPAHIDSKRQGFVDSRVEH